MRQNVVHLKHTQCCMPVLLQFLKSFMYFLFRCAGLCCYVWAFSSCSEWGRLFVSVRGFFIAVASLVGELRQALGHVASVVTAPGL